MNAATARRRAALASTSAAQSRAALETTKSLSTDLHRVGVDCRDPAGKISRSSVTVLSSRRMGGAARHVSDPTERDISHPIEQQRYLIAS
jgi:hypothetical protein